MQNKQFQFTTKRFERPDEKREFQARGRLELVNFENGMGIGRGTFEPGWKWSNDVKPIAGTESCEAAHTGYCVSGSMTIQMNDGTQKRIEAGEAFVIPPGHDAWVEGDKPCVLLDFTGFEHYAVRKPAKEAIKAAG